MSYCGFRSLHSTQCKECFLRLFFVLAKLENFLSYHLSFINDVRRAVIIFLVRYVVLSLTVAFMSVMVTSISEWQSVRRGIWHCFFHLICLLCDDVQSNGHIIVIPSASANIFMLQIAMSFNGYSYTWFSVCYHFLNWSLCCPW